MHKRTHLTVSESNVSEGRTRALKKRRNRRQRDWNRTLRRVALGLALIEIGVLLLANPYLHVTKVRVDGAQTLSPQQVFEEAHVPRHANIFGMLRQPFNKRLAADPVIDHAERSIRLPNLLVLTVMERQPKAVLAGNGQFWLLDAKAVAYKQIDGPLPGIPLVQATSALMPPAMTPGKSLRAPWLSDAFSLLGLVSASQNLGDLKIVVDQNSNLCLNRKDGLQIRLGQCDALPQKLALAEAALAAHGADSAYIDVSSPEQMVRMPRKNYPQNINAGLENSREYNGPEPRTD